MVVYRIKDWDRHFENNRTKGLKTLSWVPLPNKHDGDGYTELLDHPDGPQHYSAWVTMVQVASKCHPRGTLLRDGRIPHDPPSLARKTHIPAVIFEGAIPRLLSIGWLERIDYDATTSVMPHLGAAPPHDSAPRARAETNGTERNRREGNRRASDVGGGDVGVDALRDAIESGKVMALAQRAAKVIPCHKFADRSLVWKAAILGVCKFGESWFADSVEATKAAYAKDSPPHKARGAYFHGVLNHKLREIGASDLTCYLRTLPEPPEKQDAAEVPKVQLKKPE